MVANDGDIRQLDGRRRQLLVLEIVEEEMLLSGLRTTERIRMRRIEAKTKDEAERKGLRYSE